VEVFSADLGRVEPGQDTPPPVGHLFDLLTDRVDGFLGDVPLSQHITGQLLEERGPQLVLCRDAPLSPEFVRIKRSRPHHGRSPVVRYQHRIPGLVVQPPQSGDEVAWTGLRQVFHVSSPSSRRRFTPGLQSSRIDLTLYQYYLAGVAGDEIIP